MELKNLRIKKANFIGIYRFNGGVFVKGFYDYNTTVKKIADKGYKIFKEESFFVFTDRGFYGITETEAGEFFSKLNYDTEELPKVIVDYIHAHPKVIL